MGCVFKHTYNILYKIVILNFRINLMTQIAANDTKVLTTQRRGGLYLTQDILPNEESQKKTLQDIGAAHE